MAKVTTLDKQLTKLLKALVSDEWHDDDYLPSYLTAIKQVFIDEGYVLTLKANNKTIVLNGKDPLGYIVYYPEERLNGKEWYDRFIKEFKDMAGGTIVAINVDEIFDAAQRATGLSDD